MAPAAALALVSPLAHKLGCRLMCHAPADASAAHIGTYGRDHLLGGKAFRIANGINQAPWTVCPPGEYLVPRFNKDDEVVSHERTMAAKMLERLCRDCHLGKSLPVQTPIRDMRVGSPVGRTSDLHTDGSGADLAGREKSRGYANSTWIACK